jgi:hypothetical protein
MRNNAVSTEIYVSLCKKKGIGQLLLFFFRLKY